MAKKLSDLTAAAALTGAELMEVTQSGVSHKTTPADIVTLAGTTLAPKASPTFTGTVAVAGAITSGGNITVTPLATVAFALPSHTLTLASSGSFVTGVNLTTASAMALGSSGANALTLATNALPRLVVSSAGVVSIAAPTAGTYGLDVAHNIRANVTGAGSVNITGTTSAAISINAPAGTTKFMVWQTAGASRWDMRANATAEGGSNAGSNFEFYRYTDAGAAAVVMTLNRATGQVTFQAPLPSAPTTVGHVNIINTDSMAVDTGGILAFGGAFNVLATTQWAAIAGLKHDNTNGNYGGYLAFYTRPTGGSGTLRMTIAQDGKVGIGMAPNAAHLALNGPLGLKGYTVATLPSSMPTGSTAYVTDATAPTYGGTLVGGGAVVVKVLYNGSAWVAG